MRGARGKIRANGPFLHSILAGTVGAVCMPLAVLFWQRNRKLCLLGVLATGLIVVSSSSSGPNPDHALCLDWAGFLEAPGAHAIGSVGGVALGPRA